jgi:hypothetical protein
VQPDRFHPRLIIDRITSVRRFEQSLQILEEIFCCSALYFSVLYILLFCNPIHRANLSVYTKLSCLVF